MANYRKIIPIILKHEGGLTDDPDDRGGITNYGISLVFAKDTKDLDLLDLNNNGEIDRDDIKNLTKDQAIQIYKKYFWNKMKLDDVYSDKIALNIMDAGVNHGVSKSISMAQQALEKLGYDNISIDGKIGPDTLNALNSVYPDDFVDAFLAARKSLYRRIVETRPSQQKFYKGWMARLNSVREKSSTV